LWTRLAGIQWIGTSFDVGYANVSDRRLGEAALQQLAQIHAQNPLIPFLADSKAFKCRDSSIVTSWADATCTRTQIVLRYAPIVECDLANIRIRKNVGVRK
jgi:hypothetical protein